MKYKGLYFKGIFYSKGLISTVDVDPENCFTPLCLGELPVKDGHLIVNDLNAQAKYGKYRIGSKDAHPMNSFWVDTDKHPQFEAITDYENLDIRWKLHGVPGTFGFKLIEGLPHVTEYDYFVWKGIELDMHPYGMCYHDLHQKMSTGVIEWLHSKRVQIVIVGGLATDYCVKTTVIQLLEAGFIVILNLSACRSISKETEKTAIEEMKEKSKNSFMVVNNTEDIEQFAVYE